MIKISGHSNYYTYKLKSSSVEDFMHKIIPFIEKNKYGFFVRKSYTDNEYYYNIPYDNVAATIEAVNEYVIDMTSGKCRYVMLPHGFLSKRNCVPYEIEINTEIINNKLDIIDFLTYYRFQIEKLNLDKEEINNIYFSLLYKVYYKENRNIDDYIKARNFIKTKALQENFNEKSGLYNKILRMLNLKTDYAN
jgi:hypothetical protein